jgi:integrase
MSGKYPPGIQRASSGEWKIRASKVDPRTGHLKIRRRTLPKSSSLKDAVLAHDELGSEIVTGGKPTSTDLTLGEYAASWLERKATWLGSDGTKARYAEEIRLHILAAYSKPKIALGEMLVSAITKVDIETWFAACRNADRSALRKYPEGRRRPAFAPYSAHSINGWWRTLKQILQGAVVDRGLKVDPTLTVQALPTPARPKTKVNVLSSEEVGRLLAHARIHKPQWYAFLALGYNVGARPGELRALRWGEDVDLERGEVTLQQSQRRKYLGPTKTKEDRAFPLPPPLLEVLRWHHKHLRATHPGFGSGLVFPGYGQWRPWHELSPSHKKKLYLSPSALDEPLREMCKAVGIDRYVSPRSMRRTFMSVAEERKIAPFVIRSISGQKSEEMRNLYTDVKSPARLDALGQLAKLFILEPAPALAVEDPGRDQSGDQLGGVLGPFPAACGNENES